MIQDLEVIGQYRSAADRDADFEATD